MKAYIGIKTEAKAHLLAHGTMQFITSQLDDAPSSSLVLTFFFLVPLILITVNIQTKFRKLAS